MKQINIFSAFTTGILSAGIMYAQQAAFTDPSVRQSAVEKYQLIAENQKAIASEWAAKNNQPVRQTVILPSGDRVTFELVNFNDVTGEPEYEMTHNENAAISTAANVIRNTSPYNVNGTNITVGVWDGGSVLSTHQEFDGRVTVKDGASDHYHATHVGGTIAARGVDSAAQGMAPEAHIDSYDWDFDETEMASRAAAAPGETGKIYVSNHSYGSASGWIYGSYSGNYAYHWYRDITILYDDKFGRYSSSAEQWDEIAYNAPYYLICKSAGNDRNDGPSDGDTVYYRKDSAWHSIIYTNSVHPDGDGEYKGGYDCISHKGSAKNVLTIGATYDAVSGGLRSPADGTITGFSSWGPADDGRIKPDVVGNGYALVSTYNTTTDSYSSMSGTSMSSPNVAGSIALLLDVYNRFVGVGALRASTLKALLIHTADDIGATGPDYVYGWGLINVQTAADTIIAGYDSGNETVIVEENRLYSANTSDAYNEICSGLEELAVTICWTDPPGNSTTINDNRTPVLMNDLDLRIIAPDGTTNYPFVLDVNAPTNAATYGDNIVDNTEQIRISAPQSGAHEILVTHKPKKRS